MTTRSTAGAYGNPGIGIPVPFRQPFAAVTDANGNATIDTIPRQAQFTSLTVSANIASGSAGWEIRAGLVDSVINAAGQKINAGSLNLSPGEHLRILVTNGLPKQQIQGSLFGVQGDSLEELGVSGSAPSVSAYAPPASEQIFYSPTPLNGSGTVTVPLSSGFNLLTLVATPTPPGVADISVKGTQSGLIYASHVSGTGSVQDSFSIHTSLDSSVDIVNNNAIVTTVELVGSNGAVLPVTPAAAAGMPSQPVSVLGATVAVQSSPAAGVRAAATLTASVGKRHVLAQATWRLSASAGVAGNNVRLRVTQDAGATTLWTLVIGVPATVGAQADHTTTVLDLGVNKDTTFDFDAAFASVFESVSAAVYEFPA